jgi:hypothetical protein
MSNITVNVTNAGAANVAVSNGSTVNATVGNGGAVNVSLGTISPGNATVVSGTVQVGKVTTLAAGSNATVTNTNGTSYAAVLDFGIPAGPSTSVSVGSTTTLAAGSNASVTGTTSDGNLTLSFAIPRGTNGTTPSFTIGNVSTVAAGGSATVTATPSNGGANVTLDFGIPRGADGAGGGSSVSLSDATPSALGTASAGTSSLASRSDHVHAVPVISYANLTNVPSTFAPSAHQHAVGDVTGLQTALDSKSATSHAHNYVTALNSLTGGVTLAAGSGVTLSTSGSTLTIAATATDDADGGFYEGYVPANTITIGTQPTAQTASGGAATFSVSATSSPGGTISYQWQKQDGGYGSYVDVDGATSASLSLTGLLNTVDDADLYRVVVSATNAASVTSTSALLTVPANVITITSQPSNQTAASGAATFTASASVAPSGTASYQWQRSADGSAWANVSGATSASLALSGLTVEADGGAQFRVVVSATNAASVTSSAATLTVEANNTITITSQPSSQTASGGAATFSVAASSAPAGTPAYQWQKAEFVPARSAAWVQRTLPSSQAWSAVAYGGGVFAAVAINSNVAASSTDGLTWTQRTLPNSTTWGDIAYGGGQFLAVSNTGSTASSGDGATWTGGGSLPSTGNPGAWTVAFGNSLFVAVRGDGTIATSDTGFAWTQRRGAVTGTYGHKIAFGGAQFVVVNDSPGAGYGYVTSTDGVTWPAGGYLPAENTRAGIVYGGGLWVVVDRGNGAGSSAYYTSTNGTTWTKRTLPVTADWRAVTYGDGAFVAVSSGSPSTTLTSTDGLSWTQRTLPSTAGWRAVGFGGGTFVALSNSSKAASAAPGIGTFSNISGAASSSLALTTLGAADNGDQYRAVVSAANAASVTSQSATLTITG